VTKFVDVGPDAVGFIAVGQQATGVIAVGQSALGVFAVGQLARGVFVVGQLSLGIAVLGQLAIAPGYGVGMLGVSGVFGGAGMLMPTLALRRSDTTALTVLKVVLAIVFLVALWYIAFEPLYSALFPDEPARVLR
jgi:hypothetical protein